MAELTITDSQPLPAGLTISKSEPLAQGKSASDLIHKDDFGPSATAASIGNTLFKDVANAPKAILDFVSGHPLDDIKQAIADSTAARQVHKQRAMEAYKAGDYKTAADQMFFGSVPFLGPALGAAADEYEAGEKGPAIAHSIEILGPALADPAMEALDSKFVAAAKDKIAEAAGTTAAAAKGAAKGAAKAAVAPITLKKAGIELEVPGGQVAASAALGGQATSMMGLGHTPGALVGAAAPIVKGAYQGAKAELAARLAATPEARAAAALRTYTDAQQAAQAAADAQQAAAHAQLLDDMAVIVTGNEKAKFSSLTPEQQQRAHQLAGTTQIRPAQAQAQAPPAAAAASASAPAAAPPTAAPAPPTSQEIAQQMFEEAQRSGTVPAEAKAGEPFGAEEPDTEDFEQKARESRATDAETMADRLHSAGVPASRFETVEASGWEAIAKQIGIDWPKTKAAQQKLIRETLKSLGQKEGNTSAAGLMGTVQ